VQAGGSLLPTAASSKHGFMEKGELGGEGVVGVRELRGPGGKGAASGQEAQGLDGGGGGMGCEPAGGYNC
jgi:hypothetical protein